MANKRINDLTLTTTPALSDRIPIDGATTRGITLDTLQRTISPGYVTPQMFGAVGNGVTDDATALGNLRTYLAANIGVGLFFPKGEYNTSVAHNWAIQGLRIQTSGRVVYRYTGSGSAGFLMDGINGAAGTVNAAGCQDIRINGRILVDAPNATNAIYAYKCHQSSWSFQVIGAKPGGNGMQIRSCVSYRLEDYKITYNDNTISDANAPQVGLFITGDNASTQSAGGTIVNPITEIGSGTGRRGIKYDFAILNTLVGGTSEGCAYGIELTSNASFNEFFGIDLEVNSVIDLTCAGASNSFIKIKSQTMIQLDGATAKGNVIDGGYHGSIQCINGATYNILDNITFNFGFDNTGTLTLGTGNYLTRAINYKTGAVIQTLYNGTSIIGGSIVGAVTASQGNVAATSAAGLVLQGNGTNADVTLADRAGNAAARVTNGGVLQIPTGIENVSGYQNNVAIAALGAPTVGRGNMWFDSTTLRWNDIASDGSRGTTVVGGSAVANQFVTTIGTNGVQTRAQPTIGGIAGLGTGIAAALGVNTGSAGAPILYNGALGTPSSGTLTNATGLPISTGLSDVAWTSYAPTISAQTPGGTPPTFGSVVGKYKIIGKTVHVVVQFTIASVGTGSGYVAATIPAVAAATPAVGIAFEYLATGKSGGGYLASGATTINMRAADATSFIQSGYGVTCSIVYETT